LNAQLHRGVTLIELIVVAAIIGVLSVVIITSQAKFNKSVLLSSTAYDVALAIRSAETFGLGSRVTLQGTRSNTGYGVRFNLNTNAFLIFIDNEEPDPLKVNPCHKIPVTGPDAPNATPGNCSYNPAPTATPAIDPTVQTFTLGNKVSVTDICAYAATHSPQWECGRTALDVVFSRPNTTTYLSVGGNPYDVAYTRAYIALTAPQGGNSMYVCINATGIISVVSLASSC